MADAWPDVRGSGAGDRADHRGARPGPEGAEPAVSVRVAGRPPGRSGHPGQTHSRTQTHTTELPGRRARGSAVASVDFGFLLFLH